MNDQAQPPINFLIDWLHGKENEPGDIGVVARFVRNSGRGSGGLGRPEPIRRPTMCEPTRWQNIEDFKAYAVTHGVAVITAEQIDRVCKAAGLS